MSIVKSIPVNLEEFYKEEKIDWDLKSNPSLFPLYLFHYFQQKYSKRNRIQKEESSYYSRKSVYTSFEDPALLDNYQAWFIAITTWNHTIFFLQIGKNNFVPFAYDKEYGKDLKAYVRVQVFNDTFSSSINVGVGSDFSVLFCCNAVAKEIDDEMRKYGFSF